MYLSGGFSLTAVLAALNSGVNYLDILSHALYLTVSHHYCLLRAHGNLLCYRVDIVSAIFQNKQHPCIEKRFGVSCRSTMPSVKP